MFAAVHIWTVCHFLFPRGKWWSSTGMKWLHIVQSRHLLISAWVQLPPGVPDLCVCIYMEFVCEPVVTSYIGPVHSSTIQNPLSITLCMAFLCPSLFIIVLTPATWLATVISLGMPVSFSLLVTKLLVCNIVCVSVCVRACMYAYVCVRSHHLLSVLVVQIHWTRVSSFASICSLAPTTCVPFSKSHPWLYSCVRLHWDLRLCAISCLSH